VANVRVQLERRNSGGTNDIIFPKTSIDNIQVSVSDSTTLSNVLSGKVSTSALGVPSGVATLSAAGKLRDSQVPGWLINGAGKPFLGEITTNTNLATLAGIITSYMISHGYNDPASTEALYGAYFQCTTGVSISWTNDALATYTVNPGDEGDTTSPISLESGDMLVLKSYSESGEPATAHWGFFVMNNTYGNASTDTFGITKLSNITSYLDQYDANVTGNNVITDGVLAGLVGTAKGKIAAGNHTHTGVYQPASTSLDTIAGLSSTAGNFIVGTSTGWAAKTADQARSTLNVYSTTEVDQDFERAFSKGTAFNKDFGTANGQVAQGDHTHSTLYQPLNTSLTKIAALASTDGNFIVGSSEGWVAETGTTVRDSLDVYSKEDVDTYISLKPNVFYDDSNPQEAPRPGDLFIMLVQ
jgi:hypothetical protein